MHRTPSNTHRLRKSAALAALTLAPMLALAQGKEIKIGVIYDLTGPLAAGGSFPSYLGTKYAIDMVNERGGVEGVKIKPIYVDAQSKVDVAINEAERLVNQEKVDLVLGIFKSAQMTSVCAFTLALLAWLWLGWRERKAPAPIPAAEPSRNKNRKKK